MPVTVSGDLYDERDDYGRGVYGLYDDEREDLTTAKIHRLQGRIPLRLSISSDLSLFFQSNVY
jgi:hypothetical protein